MRKGRRRGDNNNKVVDVTAVVVGILLMLTVSIAVYIGTHPVEVTRILEAMR